MAVAESYSCWSKMELGSKLRSQVGGTRISSGELIAVQWSGLRWERTVDGGLQGEECGLYSCVAIDDLQRVPQICIYNGMW